MPVSLKLAHLLFKTRFLLFSLAIGLTFIFGFYATKIEFNFSPDTIYIESDDAYRFYKDVYLPQFSWLGTPCFLAVESQDKNQDLTSTIATIADTLKKNPYVAEVISPHDQPIYLPTATGITLFPTVDQTGQLTPYARDYFNRSPLYAGSFLAKNANAMALIFMLDLRFQDLERQTKAVISIKNDLKKMASTMPNIIFHVTGNPFIQTEMISLLKFDQLMFVPALALLLLLLLFLMTKHVLGTLFPMLIIFVVLIWTVGYLALIGHDINVVNNAIVVLIMVIGIADSVHIYTRFIDEGNKEARDKLAPHIVKKNIVINTLAAMLMPCFLTSVTTALGLLASSAAGVQIIKQFGTDTAIAVMFGFTVTFMVMPLLLWLHPLPSGHHPSWMKFWPKKLSIDSILRFSLGNSLRYANGLTIFAVIVTAFALWVARDITSNQTWVGELPKDNPEIKALDFIENNFTGIMPFYIVFSGDTQRLMSLDAAKNINAIADRLRTNSIHAVLRSPYDPIEFLLKSGPQPLTLNDIDETSFNQMIANGQQFMEKQAATDIFWSKDKKHLRMLGFLPNVATGKVEVFREFLEKTIAKYPIPGISVDVTGIALISSRALHNITRDMARSIGLAILYISVLLLLVFRSIRYALIAMLPNILPITLTIACMHLFHIDLRLATVMIFSMALGISIDTCIHLLCRVREEEISVKDKYKKLSMIRSMYHAFHGSGRPIIYTTVILLGGFSMMAFSSFVALRDFAVISSIVLTSALIADIVLLPALLLVTNRWVRK